MTGGARVYQYVGPDEVLTAARALASGGAVLAREDIIDAGEPLTFVIDLRGDLRLAPRRSEHVACAGGEPVLSAGEITFERGADGWEVTSVTNLSTGYCPEASSWPAAGRALDRIGERGFGWRRPSVCCWTTCGRRTRRGLGRDRADRHRWRHGDGLAVTTAC